MKGRNRRWREKEADGIKNKSVGSRQINAPLTLHPHALSLIYCLPPSALSYLCSLVCIILLSFLHMSPHSWPNFHMICLCGAALVVLHALQLCTLMPLRGLPCARVFLATISGSEKEV